MFDFLNKKNEIDVLCIGDTVVDAFIRLKNAEVHCELDHQKCTISMPFGTKIPYESATVIYGVGNSANAAVSVARLGLTASIATDLGDDEYGRLVVENFKKEKLLTDYVKLHKDKKTNYHYVLWYGDERTILVNHFPYSRKFNPSTNNIKFIYLSSLGGDSMDYHKEISAWLSKNPNTKLVFQPGTFQMEAGIASMKDFYRLTYVFVCNFEEANLILQMNLEKNNENVKILMNKLAALGAKIVLVTDGPQGAYMYDTVTNKYFFQIPYPDPKAPLERTGAGDAFTSTFTSALCYGMSPTDALTWAPINSMNVVQHIGAQEGLLTKEKLVEFLHSSPDDYKPIEI